MVSLKKIITVAAVATLGMSLFAQQSKTNVATAGLFDIDVDNYMNVNSWSDVKPQNGFVFFGMDSKAGGSYDLGFAKQFKKFYWGTYFSGRFGTTTSTKTDDGTTATKGKQTGSQTIFDFNNLIGLGNIGIGVDFYYNNHDAISVQDTAAGKVNSNGASWNLNVKAGLKEYKLNKFILAPRANFGFYMNPVAGTKTVTTPNVGNVTTTDTRDKTIYLGVGTDVLLGKAKSLEQTASVDLDFSFNSPMDKDVKDSSTSISLPLSYKAVINASDALAIGLKAALTPAFSFGKSESKVLDVTTTTNTFGFYALPELNVGITYATKKYVTLNAGIGIALPSYSYSSTTRSASNTSNKNKSSTSTWNGATPALSYNSGFAINPTKNVCIDCSYEILQDLFRNTDTRLNAGAGTNFWNTVNQVLVHNIGFQVSVKF